MDIVQPRIPNKLKRYRKMAGYTQKEVATALGFKITSRISSWERGGTYPSMKNLLKLSILYSTLPAELYCDLYQELRIEVMTANKKYSTSKES